VTGSATDGVRLLSQRPSVLIKVGHLATDPDADATDGMLLTGPDWQARLREVLEALSPGERAGLYAVLLHDDLKIPMPAEQVLARKRTDWFPEFLSGGSMTPHFQVIIDLQNCTAFGREALMRGKLGNVDVRGEELVAAAEAHDALFSFDARARTAALETGIPLLPDEEILFVNLDPRAIVDVPTCVRATFNVVERLEMDASRLCFEFVHAERCPDQELLVDLVNAFRERGALLCLDDLYGGSDSLTCLELLQPDLVKLDVGVTAHIQGSNGRRQLVAALVEVAHEQGCRVIAEGIERVGELDAMVELGVDYGQGFYLGQPTDRMHPVDPRLVRRSPQAA
jgi:EAL domain-containing protein (putative c-di-GMP-specific phosphodiesterase class I)